MSDDHDRQRGSVAAHALGTLSEAERASVEAHVRSCDSCSHDLERFRAVVGALSMSVAPRRAREELKQEVLQRVRDAGGTRERRPSHGRTPVARSLAGALAAMALVAGGYGLAAATREERAQVLAGKVDRGRAANATVTLERKGDIGVLRVANLPALATGVYVVWLDRDTGPAYASSFDAGSAMEVEAPLTGLNTVDRVSVTAEAADRVPRPTTRPVLTVQVR